MQCHINHFYIDENTHSRYKCCSFIRTCDTLFCTILCSFSYDELNVTNVANDVSMFGIVIVHLIVSHILTCLISKVSLFNFVRAYLRLSHNKQVIAINFTDHKQTEYLHNNSLTLKIARSNNVDNVIRFNVNLSVPSYFEDSMFSVAVSIQ